MAIYEARKSLDRYGWCVFRMTDNGMAEYHSGPFLTNNPKEEAERQAKRLSAIGESKPGEIIYLADEPHHGLQPTRTETKYIDTVPEGDHCVAMLEFKGTMYVATFKGVYQMVNGTLEAVQFKVETELCTHGKGLTECCEPCGRVNGGG